MSKSKSKKIIACIPSPTGKGKKIQGIVTKFELQNQEVVAQFTPFNQKVAGNFQIIIKFNLLIFPNHKLKQAAEEEKKKLLTKQEN